MSHKYFIISRLDGKKCPSPVGVDRNPRRNMVCHRQIRRGADCHPRLLVLLIFFISACSNRYEGSLSSEIIEQLPEKVSYNFHIRPILSDRCFSCHGFDESARKADLRLDIESEARKVLNSEVKHRIVSDDPELMMPPPESNLELNEYEKALIFRWIDQGAGYQKHWAFLPVKRPPVPKLKDENDSHNAIDAFVQQKQEVHGLGFSPEADRGRLLRRVSFDLTGLPPTPSETAEFLADTTSDAYEKLVDRLLDSDAHAERMTVDWLDAARYADSHGLHSDGWRSMYPWRDWVIKAFRNNMPYDQFLTWQMAGDLFPNPTREQLVATGFNRNHKITAEGGIVDEEYRQEYVHDRVITTATVFMGLTMECARCHDHKYDPVSQQDYYRMFAFFNQVDELGMYGDDGNCGPNLLLPAGITRDRIDSIDHLIDLKSRQLTAEDSRSQKSWIHAVSNHSLSKDQEVEAHLRFEKINDGKIDGNSQTSYSGDLEIVEIDGRTGILLNDDYDYIQLNNTGNFDTHEAFSASIWIYPTEKKPTQTLMGNSDPKANFWRGWDFILDSLNRPTLRLIHALPHDVIWVRTHDSVQLNQWTQVGFSYDGSASAEGVELYLKGQRQEVKILYNKLSRSIHPSIRSGGPKREKALRLGKSYRAFTGEYGIYSGYLDDLWIFRKKPDPLEKEIAALRLQRLDILDTVPEVMIMDELSVPRATFVLNRGLYDQPMEEVWPGTPSSIIVFPEHLPANRMGLAQWLISQDHPLTSRVIVNRLWQQLFGQGIVSTPHDFGFQGSLPTHPELLDWLAAELMENGWDLRAIIKQIVMSRTYRQSSFADSELRTADPQNIWLARGPSGRMSFEMIRDNALLASGLLVRKIGGPSVKPVQPEGLWKEKTSSTLTLLHYKPDSGAARYRRSLYTFLRRTSPPPAMTAFDAPNRSVCTVQRQKTNTPMQALVLLNDPQFVEAARHLSQQVMRQDSSPNKQISQAYQRLTGQVPSENTVQGLWELYQEESERFLEDPEDAENLLTIGQYPPDKKLPVHTLAAMTVVVNTIMSVDEASMKR